MRRPSGRERCKSARARGTDLPEALRGAIERERGNLSKAESVLECLAISMEQDADSADRPYYPDVAHLARDLIRQSIGRLDCVVLRRLLRNRVEEISLPLRMDDIGADVARLLPPRSSVHEQEQAVPI